MPRKHSGVPQAVRVRENQRNARARTLQLIKELKAKVNTYERHGVAVNEHIQKAARQVHAENQLLRELLASKGITDEEVNWSIRQRDTRPSSQAQNDLVSCSTSVPHIKSASQPQNDPVLTPISRPRAKSFSHPQNDTVPTSIVMPYSSVVSTESTVRKENSSSFCDQVQSSTSASSQVPVLEWTTECCETNFQLEEKSTPTTLTDCSMAATILAGFRGHADTREAKIELGCTDNGVCTIASVELFRAMDE